MATFDPFFTVVPKGTVSSATDPGTGEAKVSDFLTIQSLTNFAAMTAAITVAWKALETLQTNTFTSIWTPFALAEAWLVVTLVMSAYQQDGETLKKGSYWASTVFIGLINSLVLFAAAIGINK